MQELPDLLVLSDMDESDVAAARVRLHQARERLDVINPALSTGFHWYDAHSQGAGLDRVRGGTIVAIHGTVELSGFIFADLTMRFPDGLAALPPACGIAVARQLLDRVEALLSLPRVRIDQLNMSASDERAARYPLARSYLSSLSLMVERYAAVYAQWGRSERRPDRLGIVPPSPGYDGDLVDTRTGRSVVSRQGAAVLSADVPRILRFVHNHRHSYRILAPNNWSDGGALDSFSPRDILHTLGSPALAHADAELIARRLRR